MDDGTTPATGGLQLGTLAQIVKRTKFASYLGLVFWAMAFVRFLHFQTVWQAREVTQTDIDILNLPSIEKWVQVVTTVVISMNLWSHAVKDKLQVDRLKVQKNCFHVGLAGFFFREVFLNDTCNVETICMNAHIFVIVNLLWLPFFVATLKVLNLGPNSATLLAETQIYPLCGQVAGSPQIVPIQQQQQTLVMGRAQPQQPMQVVMGQAQQPNMNMPMAVVQPVMMGQAQQQQSLPGMNMPMAVVQPVMMGQAQQSIPVVQPIMQPQQPVVVGQAADPVETIRQLKQLLDVGAITPAEFEAKKAEQLSLM